MQRKSLVVVALAIVASGGAPDGQSRDARSTFDALSSMCSEYGEAELVFVGRAEAPVTFRISGEAEIEKARQNLARIEAEVARLKASLDPKTRLEREVEFVKALVEAEDELDTRRVMYPLPMDLTLVPVQVEQTFRGITEPMMMVHAREPSLSFEPGVRYLIIGYRSMVPALPGIPNPVGIDEYVDIGRVKGPRVGAGRIAVSRLDRSQGDDTR
jgi:hypothetical protein